MMRKNTLPKLLLEIVEFLKTQNLSLSKENRDKRVDSASNEDEIVKRLKNKYNCIEIPPPRYWYDFSFSENNIFYPVNIKVSAMKSADNLNCKLGIYYALTGKKPQSNNQKWEIYLTTLKENLAINDKDYYFLIINKENHSDIFATSLKSLQKIVPNGNNLPFQANWSENRNLVTRGFEEAKDFLLSHLGVSLKQRAKAYDNFKQYFNHSHNSMPYFQPIFTLPNPYHFYIACNHCGCRNKCYIENTINGIIPTHLCDEQ